MWRTKVQSVLIWASSSFLSFLLFFEINFTITLGGLFLWQDFFIGKLTLHRAAYVISVVMAGGAFLASFLWFIVIRYFIKSNNVGRGLDLESKSRPPR